MIVDKERRIIYLHNPKSGGTFLRELYIEKYGKSEATKWWKPYTIQSGTDLGHITYSDLPRFIPEWREYRIVAMVRNPYNRFYSAVNEMSKQYCMTTGYRAIVPFYIFGGEFQEWNKIRKIYEYLRMYTGVHPLVLRVSAEPEEFCNRMSLLKHAEQDLFIRNKRIPWLNPQSFFYGESVEILKYESEEDWAKLLAIFGLAEYQGRLKIAKEYVIPENICEMIKGLYPEDMDLFRMYDL